MKIPDWLRNALNHLNFDVFFLKIYVGDVIADGLQTVYDQLDDVLTLAKGADRKADEARQFTIEEIAAVEAGMNRIEQEILTKLGKLPDDYRPEIELSIAEVRQETRDKVAELWAEVRKLIAGVGLTEYGLNSIRQDVEAMRKTIDLVKRDTAEWQRKHYGLWDFIKDFFRDPASFIYHLFDEIIERFW